MSDAQIPNPVLIKGEGEPGKLHFIVQPDQGGVNIYPSRLRADTIQMPLRVSFHGLNPGETCSSSDLIQQFGDTPTNYDIVAFKGQTLQSARITVRADGTVVDESETVPGLTKMEGALEKALGATHEHASAPSAGAVEVEKTGEKAPPAPLPLSEEEKKKLAGEVLDALGWTQSGQPKEDPNSHPNQLKIRLNRIRDELELCLQAGTKPRIRVLNAMSIALTDIERRAGRKTGPDYDQIRNLVTECCELWKQVDAITSQPQPAPAPQPTPPTPAPQPAPQTPAPKPVPPQSDDLRGRVEGLERVQRDHGARLTEVEKSVETLGTNMREGFRVNREGTETILTRLDGLTSRAGGNNDRPSTSDGWGWWKNAGLVLAFLGFCLVLLVIGLAWFKSRSNDFMFATREQGIAAERSDASATKAAALAEIEAARHLQMETIDRINGLQDRVEGLQRQNHQTPLKPSPSEPSRDSGTTNTANNYTTTNIIVVTNTVIVTPSATTPTPVVMSPSVFKDFPVDPEVLKLEFDRRIGLLDRPRYKYDYWRD